MTFEDDSLIFDEIFADPGLVDYPRVTTLRTKAKSWTEISGIPHWCFRHVTVFALSLAIFHIAHMQ